MPTLLFVSASSPNSLKLLLHSSFHLILYSLSPSSDIASSPSFLTPTQLAKIAFFKSDFVAVLGKIPALHTVIPAKPVYLLADVSGDAVIADTPSLSNVDTLDSNSLCRKLHNHNLSCSEELSCVAICSPEILQQLKPLLY